jgi:hypothetical protein
VATTHRSVSQNIAFYVLWFHRFFQRSLTNFFSAFLVLDLGTEWVNVFLLSTSKFFKLVFHPSGFSGICVSSFNRLFLDWFISNIWRAVQMTTHLNMQIFPASCYFLRCRSKYFPHYPVLSRP